MSYDPRPATTRDPAAKSKKHSRIVRSTPRHLGAVEMPKAAAAIPAGVVHELPDDLRRALKADARVLRLWVSLTPLARNEFICWVEDAKLAATRARRIRRTREELEEGLKRPCCWPGCKHRERAPALPDISSSSALAAAAVRVRG